MIHLILVLWWLFIGVVFGGVAFLGVKGTLEDREKRRRR